jgi:hypothetical protein
MSGEPRFNNLTFRATKRPFCACAFCLLHDAASIQISSFLPCSFPGQSGLQFPSLCGTRSQFDFYTIIRTRNIVGTRKCHIVSRSKHLNKFNSIHQLRLLTGAKSQLQTRTETRDHTWKKKMKQCSSDINGTSV